MVLICDLLKDGARVSYELAGICSWVGLRNAYPVIQKNLDRRHYRPLGGGGFRAVSAAMSLRDHGKSGLPSAGRAPFALDRLNHDHACFSCSTISSRCE
jgi:hypothetical protein